MSLVPPLARHFGANRPVEDAPIDVRSRGADAHRSPAAKKARLALQEKIQGARRDHAKREAGNRILIKTSDIRLYVGDWLADADSEGQSPLTLEGKNVAIEKLLWFLEREGAANCGHVEIAAFLAHVRDGHLEADGRYGTRTARSYKPVGQRVLQLYFVYIRTYFKWMVERGIAEASPLVCVKQPEWKRPKVKPLSVDEISQLLQAVPKILNRRRNTAIILLFFDTGLRVSELCSLRTQDVDLVRRTITVIGKGDKERTVHFDTDVARVIRDYLSHHARPAGEALFYSERVGVFSDGVSPDGVRRMFKRLAQKAGIDPERVSPHKLRHSFATEWIRQNGSPKALQMLLGHEDMEMTYRYVSLVEADTAAQHRQHSPARLLRGKKRPGI